MTERLSQNRLSEVRTEVLHNHAFVLSLQDQSALSAEITGAKAANLAKLIQAGFPVPNGIVVTIAAFANHFAEVQAKEQAFSGTEIRDLVMLKLLNQEVRDELKLAMAPFGDVPFAVRSSGVAEDLERASFAGQYDTFLNVRGVPEVEEAVRKCWESAFSKHVLTYRSANQIAAGGMAVLIQPLVQADAAGVAFTANPVTGDRTETAVSAVRGLGERLVSGQASPDEWKVQGGSAVALSTPENAIDASQVLQVAELARQVETFYGVPQDIEWAIAGGELYLLQARPVTTLSPEQTSNVKPVIVHVPNGYWEREESHYPDPLTPATRTTLLPAANHAFRLMCDELSALIETMELREIGGWIYQRMVPLGGKDRKAPPGWLMPLLIRTVPQLKSRIAGSVQMIREDKPGRWIEKWHSDWKPSLMRRSMEIAGVDLRDLTDERLVQHVKESQRFLNESLGSHMMLNGAISLILAEFAFASRDLLDWDEAKMMLLFSGLSETSSAPCRSLAEIAQFVRGNAQLRKAVEDALTIEDLHEYSEFMGKFNAYVHLFGCRALRFELSYPTVAESLGLLLNLLKDQLQRKYDPDHDAAILKQQRRSQLAEAEGILSNKSEADRKKFQRVLERAEKAYPIREEHGFYDRDAPVALLRYALLEAGNRFANRGQIVKAEDVFFLEIDETLNALLNHSSLHETVEQRQGERNWIESHPGPASYGMAPPPPPSMAAFPDEARFSAEAVLWSVENNFATQQSGRVQTDASRIQGIAASSGRYTGIVRVILDETEFHKIQPGDVLVCPITSPVWSMLFPSIGALVTDSGGILSHSAIIAREYRIPSVVATGNATELLKDGQIVTVEGTKGIVAVTCDWRDKQ